MVRQESSAMHRSNDSRRILTIGEDTSSLAFAARATPLLYNQPAMAVKREKAFNTACQEEVYRQVKAYLDELVDEHFDDAEHCDFYLKYGSTRAEISIQAPHGEEPGLQVLA